jgi:2Fe-2S ferredoxin
MEVLLSMFKKYFLAVVLIAFSISLAPISLLSKCLEASLDNAIPGIDADCGGACACGTCHCFVGESWSDSAGEADPMEESMLNMRPDREALSRLSCQIEVSDSMEGMVVRLPEYQM